MAEALLGMSGVRLSQLPQGERLAAQQGLREATMAALGAQRDAGAFLRERLGEAAGKDFLRTAFLGLQPLPTDQQRQTEEITQQRCDLVQAAITALQSRSDLSSRVNNEIICTLNRAMGLLHAPHLAEVTEAVVAAVEGRTANCVSILQLLPQVLSLLNTMANAADVDEAQGGVEAAAVQAAAVRRICHSHWEEESVSQIVGVMREIPMSPDQLEEVMHKVLTCCRSMKLQGLPTAIYQLILTTNQGGRDTALQGIVHLFKHLASRSSGSGQGATTQMNQIEGTILYHIGVALQHDKSLGQDWLRTLRNGHIFPSPFVVSLLLLMARNQRLEDGALTTLKSMVIGAHNAESQLSLPWLATLAAPLQPKLLSGPTSLLTTVRRSGAGWEGIAPSMVKLATMLMDKPGISPGEVEPTCSYSSGTKAALLGIDILELVFKLHSASRDSILELCASRMVCTKVEKAIPYIWLLGRLVRKHEALLNDRGRRIKDAIRCLCFLDPDCALGLLAATWPLFHAHSDLKDTAVMILRKAMFSRDVEAHLLAVRGFQFLIIQELRNPTQAVVDPIASCSSAGFSGGSQLLSQMHSLGAPGTSLTLLHEFLAFLRRCLGQHAAIRGALYEGVLMVLRADPTAQGALQHLLLPHFMQYCEFDEGQRMPLRIEKCVAAQTYVLMGSALIDAFQCTQAGSACQIENLPGLLRCAQRLVTEQGADVTIGSDATGVSGPTAGSVPQCDGNGSSSAELFRKTFRSVRQRLKECVLEDFQLDGSVDFSLATAQGSVNYHQACTLLGCAEVVIEDTVMSIPSIQESDLLAQTADDLHSLFRLHSRLFDLLKDTKCSKIKKSAEGSTQSRKRGAMDVNSSGAAIPVDRRKPTLQEPCIAKLLSVIVSGFDTEVAGDLSSSAPSTSKLRALAQDPKFQGFVLRSTENYLSGCEEVQPFINVITGSLDNDEAPSDMFPLPQWQLLAAPILRAAQPGRQQLSGSGKREKDARDGLPLIATRCLHKLLGLAGTKDRVAAILRDTPLPEPSELENDLSEEDMQIMDVLETAGGGVSCGDGNEDCCHDVQQRLPHFMQMASRALLAGNFKVVEVLCGIILSLGKLLDGKCRKLISDWSRSACCRLETQVTHPGSVKALATIFTTFRGAGDLAAVTALTNQMGEANAEQQRHDTRPPPIVNAQTRNAVACVLIGVLETAIKEAEWVLPQLKTNSVSGGSDASMAHARLKIEAVVWSRLEAVARCLGELDKVVTGGSAVDRLMKVLQHMYKVLASATKHNQAPKGTNQAPPSRGFQRLVSAVHRHLTINVYELVSQLEQDEERAKGRTHAQIRWLQQQIPLLVYLVEQWEKGLIQLSKAGKVDLMRNAKRSTNRDFKIRMSQLAEDETDPEVLADGRNAEEGEEGVEEGEEGMGTGDCGGDEGDMEEKDEGEDGYD